MLETEPEPEKNEEEDTGPLRLPNLPASPPPFGSHNRRIPDSRLVGGNAPAPRPVMPGSDNVTQGPANRTTLASGNRTVPTHQPVQRAPNLPPPPPGGPIPPQPVRAPSASPAPGERTVAPPTLPPRRPASRVPGANMSQRPRPGRPTPVYRRPAAPNDGWRRQASCLLRTFIAGLFALILLALCGISILFVQYFRIARTLPGINDLRQRASQFETTRIMDRNGKELYDINDPNAGRRMYVTLAQISPNAMAATIATEDQGFYQHPGFDIFAILRAFYQNYTSGETVSGASTITQQLARALLFTPEERVEQSYSRKLREAILAAEITRQYSKDEILELYLNEFNYGNLAYGIEAAAQTYFNTSAGKLTLGQASFLAGLPQAPSIYDVYTNPDAALSRHKDVLRLMYELSLEDGCIYVSNAPERVCVDAVTATSAASEIANTTFTALAVEMTYPHWVTYIRSLLEAQYDAQTIYRLGYTVYTTLDPAIQEIAQAAVAKQVGTMAANNTQSGALVAIRPSTGEILAMVGSADFYNEAISGQVNMAINPRQPGSSIKPLTYLAAFEMGWTPSTLIWDVPSQFTPSGRANDPGPTYEPVNYDGMFRGPVTVRQALANSLNVPAVKTLQFVGIYDDPARPGEDGLVAFARRLGITTLKQPDYGLSLTLGGGEVTLLEMTGAFATIANYGQRIPPVAILKVVDHSGNVVYQYTPPSGEQVLRAEHAYLITSILSDNEARSSSFGANSPLNLPFPTGVKTGTTNDFRDNWTVGYTRDLVVGVWVGNPDYTPMVNTTGLSGAAPIWNRMMQQAVPLVANGTMNPFTPPPGIVEQTICADSGTLPSEWCTRRRAEIFAADQPPLPAGQDLWQKALVDTWTGLRASAACPDFLEEKFVLNVTDTFARRWVRQSPAGQAWAEQIGFPSPVVFAPERECTAADARPTLILAYPTDGQTIQDTVVSIYALIDAPQGFEGWQLAYGQGEQPDRWEVLAQGRARFSQPDIIAQWDVQDLLPGIYALRLYLQGADGGYAERRARVVLMVPTATPMPTSTPWPTPEATPTTWPPPATETWPPPATETFAPPPLATETFALPPPQATETFLPPTAGP